MKKLFIIFGIQIASLHFISAQVQQVNGAIIQGNNVIATGLYSSAIGDTTKATGKSSFALGSGSEASGLMSFSQGWKSQATGILSFAAGYNAIAEGNCSFALGDWAYAKIGNSFALGSNAQVYSSYGIAIGNQAISGSYEYPFTGTNAISIGNESWAKGDYSYAFGEYVHARENYSMVIGRGYSSTHPLVNNKSNTLAIGFGSTLPTMYITNSPSYNTTGKVGIGTTNIGSKLQVNGNTAIGYSAITVAPENGLLVNGNVGIGTTTATTTEKLTVNGNIQLVGNDNGVILKSPDGSSWKLTIDNNGAITTTKITAVNEKIVNDDKIEVFPNPTNDVVQIKLNDTPLAMPVAIELRNLESKLMYYQEFNQKEIMLNIQSYKVGSYVLIVRDANGQVLKNSVIIKQ